MKRLRRIGRAIARFFRWLFRMPPRDGGDWPDGGLW